MLLEAGGVRSKQEGNANERKEPGMNTNIAERLADLVGTSTVQDDAAKFQAGCAEIHQQAEMHAGCAQVVDALRAMHAVERADGLQLDQDAILHQKIDEIVADADALVVDGDAVLLRDGDAGLAQLERQGVFVNLLQEATAERVGHGQRAADDAVGECVRVQGIRGHSRAFGWVARCRPSPILPRKRCQRVDGDCVWLGGGFPPGRCRGKASGSGLGGAAGPVG